MALAEQALVLSFSVPGDPVTQGGMTAFVNPRTGRAHVAHKRSSALAEYRARVALAAQAVGASPMSGPLAVSATFVLARPRGHFGTGRNEGQLRAGAPVWPTTRPDIDKLERALLDALCGACYANDAQVVRSSMTKRYAGPREAPATVVAISPA
jgi:Holliday junction resolvase RusA-like endonuclease